jgi:hypothetical protein
MNKNSLESKSLESFISKIEDFGRLKQKDQIDYFVYYLTIECNLSITGATEVRQCFLALRLHPYSNISSYLSGNSKKKDKMPPKFLRIGNGYILQRDIQQKLQSTIKENKLKEEVHRDLRSLLTCIKSPLENDFFKEAITCFEISAYRAAVVMVWNLTIDHLYEFVLKHDIGRFNTILLKNTDKRIKITEVKVKDDFSEIPESKFIEFCKSAGIISGDIRKILDTKLGIRNTYAHPSNVKVLESKALEFIEDLVNNVLLKYKL